MHGTITVILRVYSTIMMVVFCCDYQGDVLALQRNIPPEITHKTRN